MFTITASSTRFDINNPQNAANIFLLSIGVFGAPAACSFSQSQYTMFNNVAYFQAPACVNYATSFSVTPAFATLQSSIDYLDTLNTAPSFALGLSLNSKTGFITGFPSSVTGSVVYTVTASNPVGTFTFTVAIKVMADAVSTVAGLGAGYIDGVFPLSQFKNPKAIVYSTATNVFYVADYSNRAIRKVDPVTMTVSTLAGSGNQG